MNSKIRTQFAGLTTLHFFNDGFGASILLFLPFIANEFGLTLSRVGILGTGLNVLGIFFALIAGYVAVRFGGLRTLGVAMLLYIVGYVAVGVSPSFLFVLAAFVVAGIGFGSFHSVAFALVAQWSTPQTRGRRLGIFDSFGDLGRVITSAGITLIEVMLGWRGTSLLYAAVAAAALFVLWFFFFPSGGKSSDEAVFDNVATSKFPLRRFMKDTSFVCATLACSLDYIASSSLVVFLPFLFLVKGVPLASVGFFVTAYFIGNLFGKALLGRLVDTFGNVRVFVVAELCMAAFITLFVLSQSILMIITVSVILGVVTKGTTPVTQSMVSQSLESYGYPKKAFGLNFAFISLAAAIAPIALGFISDAFGILRAFNVASLFAIVAIIPALFFGKFTAKVRSSL